MQSFRKREKAVAHEGALQTDIPHKLRVQCLSIIEDFNEVRLLQPDIFVHDDFNHWGPVVGARHSHKFYVADLYEHIRNYLRDEHGDESLMSKNSDFAAFFKTTENTLAFLMLQEAFRYLNNVADRHSASEFAIKFEEAVSKLNLRFRQRRVGYRYESGQLIRITSEFIHTEIEKPVFAELASDPMYAGSLDEFRKAYRDYQNSNWTGCIVNCCNAFESCLKAICKKKGWKVSGKRTASNLLRTVADKGLLPLDSLKGPLNSGTPALRTETGGAAHGSGTTPVKVPAYVAEFALHRAATDILLLIRAEKEMK